MRYTPKLFRIFSKRHGPTVQLSTRKNSEDMTRVILVGSFIVNALLLLMLIVSYVLLGHQYALGQIFVGISILLYIIVVALIYRKGHSRTSAWMLIALYTSIGLLILHNWGLNAPVGVLILSFVILLGSVTLGAKYIIGITIGVVTCLIFIHILSLIGLSGPHESMLDTNSTYGDVASYAVIFGIFALITWLSRRRMEKTLERAIHAETALQKQRDVLEIQVKKQMEDIRNAQQKELRQLYKFAELGQLTTIILHELANYLSILTLDIEDIKERHSGSVAIKRAKESIFYIDTIIDQARNQIKDSDASKKHDALVIIKDTISQLRKKLDNSNIKLFTEESGPKNYHVFGDPLRLSQALIVLVTNASQASINKKSEISILLNSTKTKITISVKDFGAGITSEVRKRLFQIQKSNKGTGHGIGLYVTKQIIETHFRGKIWLDSSTEYTQFHIQIPRLKK